MSNGLHDRDFLQIDSLMVLRHQVGDAGSKDRLWLTEPGADEDVFKAMSASRRDALTGAVG